MIDVKELKKLTQEFTVLYVEDDKDIQDTMHNYLNKFFKNVSVADDGEAGLELYCKGSYDIVMTDLLMPKMGGIEMIEKIKEINEDQPILITTAHTDKEYMLAAIKAGVDGYIIKPFDYDQLNTELYKIANRLEIIEENRIYQKNLEDLVEKKTNMLVSALKFQNVNYEKTLYAMVDVIEERDTYTAGHSKRVATYSRMIAQEMGYSEDECTKLYQAGMLHDIGKIVTPDAVLLKPKHLNNIEYKLIKEHVNVGYKLLNDIPMFASLAEIIYAHHERYDGSGYPRGIKDNEIPPLARVMMVADSFDAMTTNRVYKGRKSVDEALTELYSLSKIQYHPEVIDVAMEVLKNIKIDDTIHQLPENEVDEMRFAYFYKDTLTHVYNENYLELILSKNRYEKKYRHMCVVFFHRVSAYNKNNSWEEGNELLKKVASVLADKYKESLVFRIFGDDFVILCKEEISLDVVHSLLDNILKETDVGYMIKTVNLFEKYFSRMGEIEQLEHE